MSSPFRQWLEKLGLAQYGDRFEADDIDLDVLPSLSEQDLEKLGVSMGHRKKLLKAIAELDGDTSSSVAPATMAGAPGSPSSRTMNSLSPNANTPKHLADKILQSKSALEGERKQVTVLFADVKGSMELVESLDPEDFSRIMSRFFAILTAGVERFEGFVDKFTGDGIMALFGAPIAHEDHAQRACYAALHLKDEIAGYATELKREHGLSFSNRMGLNSGEVVVGSIGDDLRMDYTAQGHTVGLAQRMEALAEPNTCFVSGTTAALACGYFDLEDLGEFRVKGVAHPMRVHRLNGMGNSRNRFDLSRSRGLSRFVGRASDLRTLEDALEQTAAGNGQVIGVVAEAGTGKSRLCFEFLERCRAKGMRVFEGRAVAHGRNIPFLPILDVFRSYFGITSEDNDKASRVKIAGNMVELDQKFADTLPLVYDFLGVADPQNPAPRLDPEVRQRQLIGVIRQIIRSASEKAPTVTMIEDLHWLDPASAEFLEHMVDARQGTHSLLLLNFRPEYRAEWMQKSWYRQVPLTPLDEKTTAELLTSLLGSHATVASLARPIHKRTGGNPFFIEEVAQNLIETKHVEGAKGNYRLVTALDSLEVPATVKSVLASRIDRLPEREKRLLQTASVIGKDFPETLLSEIAGLAPDELKSAIANLRRAEFLYDLALYPSVEYAFKHPLTQEVALGSLLTERKRKIHRTLAEAIERQDPQHLDERAPLLAHHWEEAGEALQAARWHRRAADWIAKTDLSAGNRHWTRVRALLPVLPKDSEAAAFAVSACQQLLSLGWRFGVGSGELDELLEQGRTHARDINDQRAELALSATHARARLGADGDSAAYLKVATECHRVAHENEDLIAQANTWFLLVDALTFVARFPEAIQIANEGLARYPRIAPGDGWLGIAPDGVSSFWLGGNLTWTGQIKAGFKEWQRTRRMIREDGTPEGEGYVLMWAALAHHLAGDPANVLDCAQRLEGIARDIGEPPNFVALTNTAYCCAHLAGGRPAEAVGHARRAAEIFHRIENQQVGMATTYLSEALLLSGDLAEADAVATEAIRQCRHSLRGNYEAMAHGVCARIILRRDGKGGEQAAGEALAYAAELIERSRAKTLAPHLLEWRAELAAVRGDEASRASLLNQAIAEYESIGAPIQAARLRKGLGV
jgi:class 3 adenylate cyclase/tetratricopeptide (TPR) repeat protein